MNKIYNCRNNMPVYIGHYPGGKTTTPGLKPRKNQYYYEYIQESPNSQNVDKIVSSELMPQLIDPELKQKEQATKKLSESEGQPIIDLEQTGGVKRKMDALFKVLIIFSFLL